MNFFLRILCCFSLLTAAGRDICAQVAISGDIEARIASTISNMPGASTNEYAAPGGADYLAWQAVVTDILNGNTAAAAAAAPAFGYRVYDYTDTTTVPWFSFVMLEKDTASANYWGTFLFNPGSCRADLVLQAPHPKKDFNTGKEAIFVFKRLQPGGYMLSGTNRCNNTTFSTCDGSTSVCNGSSTSYQVSDPAHVTDGTFQATTETWRGLDPTAYFVQLHGFSMTAGDPYVIMSNGSRTTPVPDLIADIRDELLLADPVLTFKIGHIDLAWTRLLAFTNTQGRFINGSVDPCGTSAASGNGHFIHIEQEKTRLRDDSTGWHKMRLALEATFTCAPLAVEVRDFEAARLGDAAELSWEGADGAFVIARAREGLRYEELPLHPSAAGSGWTVTDPAAGPAACRYKLGLREADGRTRWLATAFLSEGEAPLLRFGPNPAEGPIRLRIATSGSWSLELRDLQGRMLRQLEGEGHTDMPLNLDDMPAGMYVLSCAAAGRREVKRLMLR